MSTVYFHSQDQNLQEDFHLWGIYRHRAARLTSEFFRSVLDLHSSVMRSRIFSMSRDPTARRNLERIGDEHLIGGFIANQEGVLWWNGHPVSGLDLQLNTALVAGSAPVQFLARLHGTCEIFGFIREENRAWLADLIDRGVSTGIMDEDSRCPDNGWTALAKHLREGFGNVVTSYSVCSQFPPFDSDREEKSNWDEAFAEIPKDLEISPETLGIQGFGHGLSAFDLRQEDWEARLDRVFPPKRAA